MWVEDLVLGVPSILLGAKSFYDNAKSGNVGGAALDAVGIVADVCAVALPGIPGGAGFGIKAARMAGKVDDALNTGQALIEAGKALKDGDIVRAGTSAATALAGGKHLVDAKKLEAVGDANAARRKLDRAAATQSSKETVSRAEVSAEIERRGDMQQAHPMHQPFEAGGDYSNLPEPRGGTKAGAAFTDNTREGVWRVNKARNAGVNRSDASGKLIDPTHKSEKGITPSPNEGQVDHVKARSKGGSNSPTNAQLLTREENRKKSDE